MEKHEEILKLVEKKYDLTQNSKGRYRYNFIDNTKVEEVFSSDETTHTYDYITFQKSELEELIREAIKSKTGDATREFSVERAWGSVIYWDGCASGPASIINERRRFSISLNKQPTLTF